MKTNRTRRITRAKMARRARRAKTVRRVEIFYNANSTKESRRKNIPLGLELHTFFNLQRSRGTIYYETYEGKHVQTTHLYTHVAKSNEDFQEIFDREFDQKVQTENLDASDEETRDLFRRTLFDIVRVYIERYREFSKRYPDRRSLRKEKAAESFLIWLSAKQEAPEPEKKNQNKDLYLQEAALKAVYEGKLITRKDGDKLYDWFCKYSKPSFRKARPNNCTPTTLRNKIDRFEKVIEMLDNEQKKKAIDELSILKTYENEFL